MPSIKSDWLQNRNFGVVIDAGSSGSRIQVYSWKDHRWARQNKLESELQILPTIEKGVEEGTNWHMSIKPGISSFASKPELVGPLHLNSLLEFAKQVVPLEEHVLTPVYVLATAGMRLLKSIEQQQILENTCNYIKDNYYFRLDRCSDHVQVITGEMEGIYGWLAVNYLMGGFNSDNGIGKGKNNDSISGDQMTINQGKIDDDEDVKHTTTFGFLDMGGASAQIAFVPNSKEALEHANDLTTVKLYTLAGTRLEYNVFVTTFLGFGTNEARRRYVESLIHTYHTKHAEELIKNPDNSYEQPITLLKDPCLPVDLILIDNPTLPPPYYSLQGTGSFDKCLEMTLPLLNKTAPCTDNPCLFNGVHTPKIDFSVNHFIGISEYWYSTHEIFGFNGEWDYTKFKKKAADYCSKHWNDIYFESMRNEDWKKSGVDSLRLEMQCFKSAWLAIVLHNGIEVPKGASENNVLNKRIIPPPPFQSINTIQDMEVSWTLGKMVLEASNLIPNAMAPNHPPPDPQGRGLFGYYDYRAEWILVTAFIIFGSFGLWLLSRKSGYVKRRILSIRCWPRLILFPWRRSARDGGPDYGILDGGKSFSPSTTTSSVPPLPPHSYSIMNLLKMAMIHLRLYFFRMTSPLRFFSRSSRSDGLEMRENIEVSVISGSQESPNLDEIAIGIGNECGDGDAIEPIPLRTMSSNLDLYSSTPKNKTLQDIPISNFDPNGINNLGENRERILILSPITTATDEQSPSRVKYLSSNNRYSQQNGDIAGVLGNSSSENDIFMNEKEVYSDFEVKDEKIFSTPINNISMAGLQSRNTNFTNFTRIKERSLSVASNGE
ncbi:hypothetical protein G9A89_015039 [Geosiphon pyriformis]|nr:hypothetical protein G9A89_015039 [Geosiphon pyriformis]